MSKHGFISKQWGKTAQLYAQIKTCVHYIMEGSVKGL